VQKSLEVAKYFLSFNIYPLFLAYNPSPQLQIYEDSTFKAFFMHTQTFASFLRFPVGLFSVGYKRRYILLSPPAEGVCIELQTYFGKMISSDNF
jgi:hypothetical protein